MRVKRVKRMVSIFWSDQNESFRGADGWNRTAVQSSCPRRDMEVTLSCITNLFPKCPWLNAAAPPHKHSHLLQTVNDPETYYVGPDDDERTGLPGDTAPEPVAFHKVTRRSLKDLVKMAGGKRKRTITAPYGTGATKKPVHGTVTNYYDSVVSWRIVLVRIGKWD